MPQQAIHMVGGAVAEEPSPGLQVIQGTWPVDIDADGVMAPGSTKRVIVCDISEMLSYRLGKQIPQTATFRVNYLKVSLRNVDDLNDNNGPNYFAGTWEWYAPTKHRIDAIQAYRKWAKVSQEANASDVSEFSAIYDDANSDEYKGIRFGWLAESDVNHATVSGSATNPFALVDMFTEYNDGLENDGLPTKNRALWDRKLGHTQHLGWSAVCNNGEFIVQTGDNDPVETAFIRDGEWTAPSGHCIEVLGGLLVLNIRHSSIDTVQDVDDDFDLQLDIGVSGWSAF